MQVYLLDQSTLNGITLAPGNILAWVIAGLIAGWLAGLLVRGRGYGCLGDIVLGVLGAFIGAFVLSVVPLPFALSNQYHFAGTVVIAFLGALILAAIGRLIGGSGTRRRYDWR